MQSILVCDDDKQIVEAIDIYLTGEGFQVIKAYDGYEALDLLEAHSVDLMIIDVMMPGLDGIRTTAKLRETCNIPIILLTAKSEDS
ncbi:MAG: response regulator, partial [Hungatella sp.]